MVTFWLAVLFSGGFVLYSQYSTVLVVLMV
jgi:hypothetical protein